MAQSFTIQGELTDLNSFLKAVNSNRFVGAKIKATETARAKLSAQKAKLKPATEYPVYISYHWYSKNRKKDIDNIAYAKKYINDGLVEAGVLKNDGQKYVAGFRDNFYIDETNPRVEIFIEDTTNSLKDLE